MTHIYDFCTITKSLIFVVTPFISLSTFAQEEWTRNDSLRLSKIMNNEIPITINDAFKKELEETFTRPLMKKDRTTEHWMDFILDIKPDNGLMKNYKQIKPTILFQNNPLTNKGLFGKRREYMKIGNIKINSLIDTESPFTDIKRSSNLSIPLNRKFNLNMYGNYTFDKRGDVGIPSTPTPLVFGAGLSYKIGKNAVIESQTNYQYNIIYKKWEWFLGLQFSITF